MACPDTVTLRTREDCGCRTKPARAARLRLQGYNDSRMLGAMDAARMRWKFPTLGQVIGAYPAEGVRILKDDRQAKRNVNDLRRVVAFGNDLRKEHTGGVRGVKIGAKIADAGRIDALEVTVLNRELGFSQKTRHA